MLSFPAASVRLPAFGLGLLLTAVPASAQIQLASIQAPAAVLEAYDVAAGTVQDLSLPFNSQQSFQAHVVMNGVTRTLNLHPVELRAPNYKLLVDTGAQLIEMPRSESVTFQGNVAGFSDSSVAVSLVNGQLRGVIDLPEATWGIQPVSTLFPTLDRASHLVYQQKDAITPQDARCGNSHEQGVEPVLVLGGTMNATLLKEAEVALDCDNLFYTRGIFGGGSVTQSEAAATNIINGVSTIYKRDVSVQMSITQIIVRTTAVYSGSISNRLSQFTNRWRQNHTNIPRDFAHLLSGQTGSGVIGVAQLGVICSMTNGFGSSQVGFSNSLTSWRGLVAHESGHQFSGPHCSGGTCFIMCASFGSCGRNMTKFGPSSITRIGNYAASRSCLSNVSENAPTLTAVLPTSVNSHLPQGIQLTGTDLESVTSVQVGSATVTNFSSTATTLNFAMPTPFEIAAHNVSVTNSVGTSNTVSLTVTGNHPSVLVTPGVHFSGNTDPYSAHTDKNWLAIYFLSSSLGASTIPGLVDFGIGNGFTDGPHQVTVLAADDTGTAVLNLTMPAGLTPGTFLYWQLVTYDPANLSVPLEVSNVRSVPVF